MSLYKRKNGLWHYDVNRQGTRLAFSTGVKDRKTALKIVRERLAGRVLPTPPIPQEKVALPPAAVPASARFRLGDIAPRYLKEVRKTIHNTANYKTHARRVQFMVDQLGANKDMLDLTDDDLEATAEMLESRANMPSPRTVNSYVVETIRPMFKFLWFRFDRTIVCPIHWPSVTRASNI